MIAPTCFKIELMWKKLSFSTKIFLRNLNREKHFKKWVKSEKMLKKYFKSLFYNKIAYENNNQKYIFSCKIGRRIHWLHLFSSISSPWDISKNSTERNIFVFKWSRCEKLSRAHLQIWILDIKIEIYHKISVHFSLSVFFSESSSNFL